MHAQLQFFRDVSWIMDPEYNHLNTILGIFGGENWSINLIRTHMRGTYIHALFSEARGGCSDFNY